MMQFKGFKPQAMQRIAGTMGYQGDMSGFNTFLQQNPDKMQMMNMYQNKAMQMVKGGMVKMQQGGMVEEAEFDPSSPYMRKPLQVGSSGAPTGRPSLLSGVKQPIDFDPKADPYKGTKFEGFTGLGNDGYGSISQGPMDRVLSDGFFVNDPRRTTSINDVIANRVPAPKTVSELSGYLGPSIDFDPNADPRGILVQDGPDLRDATQYLPQNQTPTPPQQPEYQGESITELQAKRAIDPSLPYGTTVQPVGTQITSDQIIDPRSGQVTGDIQTGTTQVTAAQADVPTSTPAATMDAAKSSDAVANAVAQTTAAQGQVDPNAIVNAQQATSTSVSDLEAAQGKAVLMDNPVQRKVEQGELVSPSANAATAAKFTEEVQAAQATPTKQATVQGQLETLMQQFEGGATPAWAAGAMRNATATMAARGLGASSMAGQALVQAAMESALPVAQADAKTIASFEAQNLSNRQQRAMIAAEQRAKFIGQEFDQSFQARVMNASKISDIANMNFTAEQQVALENSRAANTMNLANLGNRQALVMSEAAALANMDMANLNNRQQAAVMNAQSFLQMDMANLNNQQQTELFKAQQTVQSLFTDQAAENAARQFNATSQNQTDQFFANLQTQASQFNTSQANAISQFNAGEANVMEKFAAEMMNQRDQFNAQNRLVIDQQNAQWRRQVATADTAAINRANEINATNLLNISNNAYNDLWSYYQDSMEYAWNSAENERGRLMDLTLAKLEIDAKADIAQAEKDYQSSAAWGSLVATMFTSPIGGDTLLGKGLAGLGF